jgi:hypothetical protein
MSAKRFFSMTDDDGYQQVRKIAEAKTELYAQQERGEWSGLIDTSGSPIYTLAEIGNAVVRSLSAWDQEELKNWPPQELRDQD